MDPSASLNPNGVGDSDSSLETVDSVYSTLYVYRRYRHHPTLSLSLSLSCGERRTGRREEGNIDLPMLTSTARPTVRLGLTKRRS